MNAPGSLANLTDLIAALLPGAVPSTPAGVGSAPQGDGDFASVLSDAREQADARPEARPPAERPELDPETAALLAALIPDTSRIEPAMLEPVEIPTSDAGPVEPRAPEKPATQPAPADAVPQLLAPSLVNLVLGTAAGVAEAPRAETAANESPAPRAPAASERRAHVPLPPLAERDPHEPAARPPDFESLEPARPARESEPRSTPRHEAPVEPAAPRPVATDAPLPPAQPAADVLAPRSAAHADAALRAAQESVPAASSAPAAADVGPARDPSATAHAARALPELPARGEVEVVHSVRVLAEQGGGRVHIRLDPPELGGLSLRVVVSDGSVHVSLLADQAPVADLLQRHSAELRSALENHGLRLDQLDVGTGQADLGSRDAHPREAGERTPSGGRRFTAVSDPIALPLRRYDVSTLGVLDLHV